MNMANLANVRWLNCQLDRGMFSDEMAVTYPPTGEPVSSVFVPIDHVQGNAGSIGKVRVAIAEDKGRCFALLPSQERTIVLVQPSDISDMP